MNLVEDVLGSIGDAVIETGVAFAAAMPAIAKFAKIEGGDVDYYTGKWDTAADNRFDFNDIDLNPQGINEILWNMKLGVYVKGGYINRIGVHGMSLISVEIDDLSIEVDGFYIILAPLNDDRASPSAKDQYKAWKVKKLAENPDFFNEDTNIADLEVNALSTAEGASTEGPAADMPSLAEMLAPMMNGLVLQIVQWLVPHLGTLRTYLKSDVKISRLNMRVEIPNAGTKATGLYETRGIFWQGEVFTLNEPSEKEEDKYGVEELRKQDAYKDHSLAKSVAVVMPSLYLEQAAKPITGSGPSIASAMDSLLDKDSANGVHMCVNSSARVELAMLLKLSGMNASSLVNMKVMDIVKNFAVKMIGIDTSGGIDINYTPEIIDVILKHAELKLFKLPGGSSSKPGGYGYGSGSGAKHAGKAALKPSEYEKALESSSSSSSSSNGKKTVSVHMNIRTLTGLEFYIYNFLLTQPPMSPAIDLATLTKIPGGLSILGWAPDALIQILGPKYGQPMARFLYHAPLDGGIFPYLKVTPGPEQEVRDVRYEEFGTKDKDGLGLRINTYTQPGVGSATHEITDCQDNDLKMMVGKKIAFVGGQNVYTYSHDELVRCLSDAPKPVKIGFY